MKQIVLTPSDTLPNLSPKCNMETHLRKKDYEIRPVDLDQVIYLVRKYHYAKGCSHTAVQTDGLFRKDNPKCLGVTCWLPPTKGAAITVCREGDDWRKVLALTRMVLRPEVPTNGASFLLSRSIRRLKKTGKWTIALTYADSRVGHTGKVYLAQGWTYLGETKGTYAWTDPTGKQVSLLSTKTRTVREMIALGYIKTGPWTKHKYTKRLD